MVLEAYRDQVGVWTWGIGITQAAGVDVLAYKDRPVSVQTCLDAFAALVKRRYWPDVLEAFGSFGLTEAQSAAALSFHYNTGAIGTATWVQLVKDGDLKAAEASMMTWCKPQSLVPRRASECALFFQQKWPQAMTLRCLGVKKPGYSPDPNQIRVLDVAL